MGDEGRIRCHADLIEELSQILKGSARILSHIQQRTKLIVSQSWRGGNKDGLATEALMCGVKEGE